MALTTEELVVLNTSKSNTQIALDLMNQVFTYTTNYKDINANSDSDVSISYIDSNGVEQSYTVPTFYKMNTTFQNLMTTMSDGNNYYTKTEVDTKDSAIETIAKRGGFKNLLINGNFDVWQRGNIFTESNNTNRYYTDRWRSEGYNFTGTLEKLQLTNGELNSSLYALKATVTDSSNGFVDFTQRVEYPQRLSNLVVTFSIWLKADSNISTGVLIRGNDTVQPIELTTSWQKFTLTINVGNMYGGQAYTTWGIRLVENTIGTIYMAQAQLEVGDVATDFELRDYGLELSLCQRYFRKINGVGIHIGTGYSYSTTNATLPLSLTPEMRVIPTLIVNNVDYVLSDSTVGYSINSISLVGGNTNRLLNVDVTTSGGLTSFRPFMLVSNGWSNFIELDAEI